MCVLFVGAQGEISWVLLLRAAFPSVSDCARWEILPFREKSFDLGDFLVKLFEENGMPLEGYFLCVQD